MAIRSEFKIQQFMQECKVTRRVAVSYLESDNWIYHHAVESYRVDSHAVKLGILQWKPEFVKDMV